MEYLKMSVGDRKLIEIVRERNINSDELILALDNVGEELQQNLNFKEWPLELLVDYVTKYHHARIRDKGPELLKLCEKVANVHGATHPELIEVAQLFSVSLEDLLSHLMKEDNVLYPFIYQMVDEDRVEVPTACFGAIEMPISVMMHEHDVEGERFRKISSLTDGYAVPEDACASYRLMLDQLAKFEKDLHEHIHIENNIIFPIAIVKAKSISV